MSCYSYTSNSPVILTNIEYIHNIINANLTFSYNSIAWICEFPVNSQLKVYTKESSIDPEVLLVENTHYTVNTTTNNIVVPSFLKMGSQLIIRRKTPVDKMLYSFTDGAKLTATQLNQSFNQLLFGIQDSIFTSSNQNFYYTVSTIVPAWASGNTYALNAIVSHVADGATALYKCIVAGLSTIAPKTATTVWTVINPSSSGFIITGGPTFVNFDLTNLNVGKAIIWDGGKFVSSVFTGNFSALTGVSVGGATSGDILRYDGTNWANAAPSVTITAANPVFNGRTFYANNLNTNYTNGGSVITPPGSGILSEFKNANDEWVLTDPITSYRILQKTIPSPNVSNSALPESFFSTVNSQLVALAANVTNPVKVKFHWDLSYNVTQQTDWVTNQGLMNPATALWDSPEELYSAAGYGIAVSPSLRKHGVQITDNNGRRYYSSPYFSYNTDANGADLSYKPKVKGYGIKSFYLSIPSSSTSCLSEIPKMTSTTDYFTVPGTVATLGDFTTALNAIGDESTPVYRDYYLMGLRDMAFAGARPTPSLNVNAKDKDALSRYKKGNLISAEYTGLSNITFKRLEDSGDGGSNCLWKIPKQIIYYNKAALAFADKTASDLTTASVLQRNTVRFTGYSKCIGTTGTANANSTVMVSGMGNYYKADAVWSDWCASWSTDGSPNNDTYRFNEADIDWITQNITTSSNDLTLYRSYGKSPPYGITDYSFGPANRGAMWFPWMYRPNYIHDHYSNNPGYTDGLIGTHSINIDGNCIFSDASNFIPDPTDEYVYRIVTKKGLLPYFKESGNPYLKTSIILEYGFTDHNFSNATTLLSNKNDIFKSNMVTARQARSLSRFNKTNTRVYVKHETVETTAGFDRYVITLGIQVPRLKSIGYSKMFRRYASFQGGTFPEGGDSLSTDTEIDSGPWFFDLSQQQGATTPGGSVENDWYFGHQVTTDLSKPIGGPVVTAGRNECAVKFTRLGLPTNLWIRLSVLNTDGSLELLDSAGSINNTE